MSRVQLSQRALAIAADVSQPTVMRIEAGMNIPALDTLERIARALRVSAGWLAYECSPMAAGADQTAGTALAGPTLH